MSKDIKEDFYVIYSVQSIWDLIMYTELCGEESEKTTILVVNANIPFVKKILKRHQFAVLYARTNADVIADALLDMVNSESLIGVTFEELYELCKSLELWVECYQGDETYLLNEAETWSTRLDEHCVLLSISGDIGLSFSNQIAEMVKSSKTMKFDCRYKEGEEIQVCHLWEKE